MSTVVDDLMEILQSWSELMEILHSWSELMMRKKRINKEIYFGNVSGGCRK